jgi:hypothetical protein
MDYHERCLASIAATNTVMLKKLFEKRRAQTVMGRTLREPSPTWQAGFWATVYFGLPFLSIAVLIDVAIEWFTGQCLGLWCYFQ